MGFCHSTQQLLFYKFKTLLQSAGSLGSRYVFLRYSFIKISDDIAARYANAIDKTGLCPTIEITFVCLRYIALSSEHLIFQTRFEIRKCYLPKKKKKNATSYDIL